VPAEKILRQIRSLGVDASRIRDLILTHAHADHITGAPVLKKAMPWICPGHCGAYAGEDAARCIELSRAELKWVADYIAHASCASEKIEAAKEILFDRYYVAEATMFSEESTRCCMDLLIRRILSSKAYASRRGIQRP